MTATEPASLDALLRTATPVEAEPFDIDALMDMVWHGDVAFERAKASLARYVSSLRCTIDDRERVAVNLEADAANVDQRIREALGYLGDALVWATDDNTRDCVSEAIAALKGES